MLSGMTTKRDSTPILPGSISPTARRPANSVTVVAKLATTSTVMANRVILTPKFSRIRAARPLPVTAPMRAAIS